jgi:hypothetical protein
MKMFKSNVKRKISSSENIFEVYENMFNFCIAGSTIEKIGFPYGA